MTTKSKNKSAAKKTATSMTTHEARFRVSTPTTADRRKELLARVAGSIAAGLVASPSPSIASPSAMATAAVDIAAEILKRAGISSGTAPTKARRDDYGDDDAADAAEDAS